MLILSIDTSARGCSVALHQDNTLLALYDLFADKSSSAMLTTLINQSVVNCGFSLQDLDAIAVAKGPGSYTGLRVGVSTAKGLCYSLGKPLIAINTLEAMCLQIRDYYTSNTIFCPMIDARRMEVYSAIFDHAGNCIRQTEAQILNEGSFQEYLCDWPMVFFGDGASKSIGLIGKHSNAHFPDKIITPCAGTVAMLALGAYIKKEFHDIASFEPYYLKDYISPTPRKKLISG